MKNEILIRAVETPAGRMAVGSFGESLCMLDWVCSPRHNANMARMARCLDAEVRVGNSIVTDLAERQLEEYFAKERFVFDIPCVLSGTDFQKKVWRELVTIPYGATLTYLELAGRMNCPESVRAVASACGANALSIILPCHRVVGKSGSLTGYAGGLEVKRFLLALENSRLW